MFFFSSRMLIQIKHTPPQPILCKKMVLNDTFLQIIRIPHLGLLHRKKSLQQSEYDLEQNDLILVLIFILDDLSQRGWFSKSILFCK